MRAPYMMLFCAALATSQTPQRTIVTSPKQATQSATDASAPTADSLAEAYRRQLERIAESEKNNSRDAQNGNPPGNAFVQSGSSPRPAGALTPKRTQPAAGRAAATDAAPDLNRSLANLDEIRDKYIEQAGTGTCPPAILMRIADLKWRLAQRGIAVASPQRTAVASDYVAIGEEWFKSGESSSLEPRQAELEDVLPATMVTKRRAAVNADAEEDTARMRSDYEALAQACAGPVRQTRETR